jgi:hypothetical protein
MATTLKNFDKMLDTVYPGWRETLARIEAANKWHEEHYETCPTCNGDGEVRKDKSD